VAEKRAVVIGGSLAGLFAGIFLRDAGWRVTIHERVGAELGSRGAGIVTHDELIENLRRATGYTGAFGVPVPGRVVLDAKGGIVCASDRPQVLASWDRLWRILRDTAGEIYRQPSAFESLNLRERCATVRFVGGDEIEADLVVCADGIRSTARRQLLPEVTTEYAGYIAWRGLVDEDELSPHTRTQLMDRFGFCLPPREQMLGYPVDGAGPGRRRYNYVWYRPADRERELPALCQGIDGKRYTEAIPPDQIKPEVLAEMREAAERTLAPSFAEIVRKTRQPLLQPIFDLQVPRMVCGRVAIIGDAAFVARPHVGMGVTKAAGDAYALARHLGFGGDIDAALASFDRERVAFGGRIIRRARNLGAYMQSQLASEEERRVAEQHRDPRAVMIETASMVGIEDW
jgi:2-polyprenyl-6-methoxyphenol hydroxylase-like FAD-dependent oxidoreductase